jgi:glycosyltransferase involved in cell wall biosynthesis
LGEAVTHAPSGAAPTLSVLMPNYNHARYLPQSVEAILGQSYQPLEFVIVDDGSTDDSVALLRRYEHEARGRIRLILNEQNCGVVKNVERMLETARGEYLYFAAADDLVLPGFFERCMRLLARHPQAALCTALTRVIDVDGRDLGYVSEGPFPGAPEGFIGPEESRRWLMKRDFSFTGNSTIYHRGRLLAAGAFRRELGPFCDGFIMQALALRHGACIVQEGLASGRMTGSNFALTLADSEKALEVHDVVLRLMQGEFADVFTPVYISLWTQRSCYNITRTLLRRAEQDTSARLAGIADRAAAADALFLRTIAAALAIGTRTAVVAAVLFLRRRDMRRLLRALLSRRARRNRELLRKVSA